LKVEKHVHKERTKRAQNKKVVFFTRHGAFAWIVRRKSMAMDAWLGGRKVPPIWKENQKRARKPLDIQPIPARQKRSRADHSHHEMKIGRRKGMRVSINPLPVQPESIRN